MDSILTPAVGAGEPDKRMRIGRAVPQVEKTRHPVGVADLSDAATGILFQGNAKNTKAISNNLFYESSVSGMTHSVVYPPAGYFIETHCGVKLTDRDHVHADPEAAVTCNACKYEASRNG